MKINIAKHKKLAPIVSGPNNGRRLFINVVAILLHSCLLFYHDKGNVLLFGPETIVASFFALYGVYLENVCWSYYFRTVCGYLWCTSEISFWRKWMKFGDRDTEVKICRVMFSVFLWMLCNSSRLAAFIEKRNKRGWISYSACIQISRTWQWHRLMRIARRHTLEKILMDWLKSSLLDFQCSKPIVRDL